MKVANRLESLPAYVFARMGDRLRELASQGVDVIRLDIGSPDLPPPDAITDALYHSAQKASNHGYGGYYGIPELRRAMAGYYEQRFNVALSPEKEVVPLIGSKEGIANVALAFVDPGDTVLVPDPGYPTYSMGTLLAGGTPYCFPLSAERGFLPDLEAIPSGVADSAKMLWLNYPNNPTGAIAPLEVFEDVVAFARRHDLLVCHDNPYCDVTFDGYRPASLLEVPGAKDVALEFNSLSKTYNMAGWRVGMAVGNPVAVAALARVKTNVDSGMFRAIQDASVLALTGDQGWLTERNEIYRQRRDMILAALPELGMGAETPQASLYIWARVPKGTTSAGLATRVLEEAAVSITPGTAFGDQGEGYVRISLGMGTERIREALERLKKLDLRAPENG
ncbi:MAG: aminotransferase class I/II-fold pyridoxal phosphate-dependent enzyme [Chloroflexi bacterium]|nr:MAG: aminotransferase class I/II-fold pyridoxal phosphate-dependent enzyme [Chloroflexota bacterium]